MLLMFLLYCKDTNNQHYDKGKINLIIKNIYFIDLNQFTAVKD